MRTMATTTKGARPSLIAGERQRLLLFVEVTQIAQFPAWFRKCRYCAIVWTTLDAGRVLFDDSLSN
jgi:hypothetical protein